MNGNVNIQGLLNTTQAAEASGLTAHRIGCLARAGEIRASKVGNTLLIDAASLQSYVQNAQGRGRPFDPQMAFAALWTLSGIEPNWLTYSQANRMRTRLAGTTAEALVWQCRRRAQTHTYRVSDSFKAQLAESLVLSGRSSLDIPSFGLTPQKGVTEGYCSNADLDSIVQTCHLAEDAEGNAIIHVASWLPNLPERTTGKMPIAVVAADLTHSISTREHSAGIKKLKELLSAYQTT